MSEGFKYLNLSTKSKDQKLVESVLLGTENTLEKKLACCLIIIYRFRNNFFHGEKWVHNFKDQQENFEMSNRFLVWCLTMYSEKPELNL